MARVLGVNGIHNWSWSKDSFTDKILDALSKKHEVVDVAYPRMWAMLAYFDGPIKRRAKNILEVNVPGDILVAHSFGCLASIYAMKMGAKFSKVFFFGAACEVDVAFPEGAFDVLYNIHSDGDSALEIGMRLPAHRFGGLGLSGYAGKDVRITNWPVQGLGHNEYVGPKHLCEWVKFIDERIAAPVLVAA